MTNRRGLLRGLGLGALGTAAGALGTAARARGIAAGARTEAPQERPSLPLPADPEVAPDVGAAPDDPFLSWGERIQRQAGCDASCSTVRYSAIEGIVAIRHEGFPGPIVKLLEDDWFGVRAAPREMTAIQLLRRKHGIWSGKLDGNGKSHETEFTMQDWDALFDQKIDALREAESRLSGKLISREEAEDLLA